MTTWVPSDNGTGASSTRARGQLTDSDMSAAGSRSTIQAVDWRSFSSVSWPSIQMVPRRSMYLATRVDTARTGQGFSAEFAGSAALDPAAPDPAPVTARSLRGHAGDSVAQQGLERGAS